jgi:hypothetical protein
MPHQRDWIDYLVAFAPLIAIFVAIGVALMQAYLQRQQLKQNLYDRRFNVRQGVLDLYYHNVSAELSNDPQFSLTFYTTFQHALNLFGSDVIDYIKSFGAQLRELHERDDALRQAAMKGQVSDQLERERNDLYNAVNKELVRMNSVFDPYLQLYSDQGWFTRLAHRMDWWVNQEIPADLKSRYQSS